MSGDPVERARADVRWAKKRRMAIRKELHDAEVEVTEAYDRLVAAVEVQEGRP